MNFAPVMLATLVASVVASGILVGAIALVARNRTLDARARHALWFGTLLVLAALPIVGIATSLATAYRENPIPMHETRDAGSARGMSAAATRHEAPAVSAARRSAPATAEAAVRPQWGAGVTTALHDRFASWSTGTATVLLLGLALGTLGGLLGLIISLARLAAVKRRSSPLDQSLAGQLPWLTAASTGRESYLRLSYEIETPVAIGFGRPVILIPTDLATQSGLHAIEDLVVHEHAHIERYDDYTNLIQRIVERLFWFNPFVWFVGRRLTLEREIAADDKVVARTADSARYAESLLQLAREMRMPTHALVAPGALFTRKQISIRIEALLSPGRGRLHGLGPLTSAGALVIALVCVGIVAVAAPPLELPVASAAAQKTVAWEPAPSRHTDRRGDAEGLAALNNLSDLIANRISSLQAEVKGLGPHPSAERVDDLASTTNLLGAKLDTMKGLAQHIGTTAMQARIDELQTEEARLGGTLQSLANDAAAPPRPAGAKSPEAVPQLPAVVQHPPAQPATVSVAPQPPAGVRTIVQLPDRGAAAAPAPSGSAADVDLSGAAQTVRKAMNMIAKGDDGDAGGQTTLTRSLIARCTGCDLSGRDLRNIDLHGVKITGADMRKTNLSGANLAGTIFEGTDLGDANLDGANLTGAHFIGADIGGATFHGARMDGVKFVGISLRRAGFDPAEVRQILLRGCEGCDLSHMDLRGVDFHGVSLTGVDLSHSDLSGADLSGAKFTGVDFTSARLDHVNFRNATLQGCSLSHASLDGAQLDGISLIGTSLSSDR